MKKGFRKNVKRAVPEYFWPFFKEIDRYIINILYTSFAFQRYFSKKNFKYIHSFQQKIPTILSNIPLNLNKPNDLEAIFKDERINFKSGRHSIYIENIEDIKKINKKLYDIYPRPFGLKIIKSRELSPEGTVYYTSSKLASASTWFSMVAVGNMLEKIVISNILHSESVAPRIYDIIRLESADGGWQYAFVVQHIDGKIVTGLEGEKFIKIFKNAMHKFKMQVISIKEHSDLRPPLFRKNIVGNQKQTFYVDIQNFVMFDGTFAKNVRHSTKLLFTNCYHTLPFSLLDSKRNRDFDEQYRKTNIDLSQFLNKNGVDLNETIIIDIGQDNGFFAMNCLHLGARWVFFLREKKLKPWLYNLMTLLGFSRFQIFDNIDSMTKNIDKLIPKMTFFSSDFTDQDKDYLKKNKSEIVIIESNSDDIDTLSNKKYIYVDRLPIPNDKGTFMAWNLFKKI